MWPFMVAIARGQVWISRLEEALRGVEEPVYSSSMDRGGQWLSDIVIKENRTAVYREQKRRRHAIGTAREKGGRGVQLLLVHDR